MDEAQQIIRRRRRRRHTLLKPRILSDFVTSSLQGDHAKIRPLNHIRLMCCST